MAHFEHSSVISAPRKEVYSFVCDVNNLSEMMAADYKVEVITPIEKLKKGTEYEVKISRLGISVIWGMVVEETIDREMIRDRQSHGPFALWVHTKKFEDHGESTLLTDIIEYDVPFGLLGKLADDLYIRRDLENIFRHRHENIQNHFTMSRSTK